MTYFLVALFGGYTGSFVCVILERRAAGRAPDGRSTCVCGRQIPMYRNIPIVTWLLQRGKAHCCGSRIPAWYFSAQLGVDRGGSGRRDCLRVIGCSRWWFGHCVRSWSPLGLENFTKS